MKEVEVKSVRCLTIRKEKERIQNARRRERLISEISGESIKLATPEEKSVTNGRWRHALDLRLRQSSRAESLGRHVVVWRDAQFLVSELARVQVRELSALQHTTHDTQYIRFLYRRFSETITFRLFEKCRKIFYQNFNNSLFSFKVLEIYSVIK